MEAGQSQPPLPELAAPLLPGSSRSINVTS